ncbi:hypothetical protein GCM10009682_05170 [Luedemannella flava]|uniref:Uncharacterized protein n=1 Tax=Luedemannella flava TaxID=349316 RepID=A0ABN2LGL7_9ACTN
MYSWIWRKLPFGLPGKITGSVLLTVISVAILWFWAFPAVEPLLPFDDVQVEQSGDTPASQNPDIVDPSATPSHR